MDLTEQGKAIYMMLFPELTPVDSTKFERICNPFYDDTHPDLGIFCDGEIWRHKDWGEPDEFKGDAIDMAAMHYKLDRKKDFPTLLIKIATDLKLSAEDFTPHINIEEVYDGYRFNDHEWWLDHEGLEKAHDYFKAY